MGLRMMRGVVGIGIESVFGTFLEPVAAGTFPAFDIEYSVSGDSYERKESSTHFGKGKEVPGPAMAELAFKMLWHPSGAASTPPHLDTFLRACGMHCKVYTASPKVEYLPWSTLGTADNTAGDPDLFYPQRSYSLAVWRDGVRYSIRGALGNVVITHRMGEPIEFAFSFKGAYEPFVADAEMIPAAIPSTTPVTFLGATFTMQSFAAVFEEFSIDLGNVLSNVIDANNSSGIKGVMLTDRRIIAKVNPEVELPATHDFFSLWRAGTSGAINYGPVGSGAGNRIQFAAPVGQYRAPSLGEREGMQIADIEIPIGNTGTTEGADFTLTFL